MHGTVRRRLGASGALVALLLAGPLASWPAAAQQEGADAASPFDQGAVYLEADEVIEDETTGGYIARGSVEARYGQRTLRADEVIYLPGEDRVIARGNVTVVQDDGVAVFSEEIELASDLSSGVGDEVGIRLPDNATIGAARIIRRSPTRNEFDRAFYTACDACSENGRERRPTWRLRARRVVQDQDSEMVYYRDAVFELGGVPVLYMPYFAHSDPTVGRHSGFMLPAIGDSSALGTFYEQPYFWAISDHTDLTISPRYMSNVNPWLGLEFRRRFHSGFVEFVTSGTYEQDVDADGVLSGEERWRSHIFGEGAFRINRDWDWGFGIERVSDPYYMPRYEIPDIEDRRGLYNTGSQRLISQLFAVGQDDDYYASLAAISFQTRRFGESNDSIPNVLPAIEARRAFNEPLFGGRVEARASTAFIERNAAEDSRRITAELDWRRPIFHDSGLVTTPFALARADIYNISDYTNSNNGVINDTFVRGLSHVGADFRYPLGRSFGGVNVVLEPYVSLVFSPEGGNNRDIPNEDSLLFDFDESSFIDVNRNGGYDSWEDGARATVGGRAMAFWNNGGEASVFLGQIYRGDDNNAFDPISGLDGSQSDIIGSTRFFLNSRTGITTSFRLDEADFDLQRLDVDFQTSVGPVDFSFRYLDFADQINSGRPLESARVQSRVRFTDHLGAFASADRNLDTDITTRSITGLYYRDECLHLIVSYENNHVVNPEFQDGDTFRIQFTLRTLGTFEPG